MRCINITLKPGEESVRCHGCEQKSLGSWVFICYRKGDVKKTTYGRSGYDGEHSRYEYEWDVWYVTCPECGAEIIIRRSEERSTLYRFKRPESRKHKKLKKR